MGTPFGEGRNKEKTVPEGTVPSQRLTDPRAHWGEKLFA